MSEDRGQTVRGFWLFAGLAAVLLAAVGLGSGMAFRQAQQQAALTELQARLDARKGPVNAWLAHNGVAGVAATPEAMAELTALVQPSPPRWPSEDGALFDAQGRAVIAPQVPSRRPDQVSAELPLPVSGHRLMISVARLELLPDTPFRAILFAVLAAEAVLAVAALAWQRMASRSSVPTVKPCLPLPGCNVPFLGRLSHEIRTPLNGVLGTVNLLLKTPLSESQRELAELTRASGEALLAAVDDLLERPHSQVDIAQADASGDQPRFSGTRVLLVEDNPTNQIVARLLLDAMGCSVEVAGDGQVALQQLDQHDYDVLLMDCEMPVLDGFATTAAIRRRDDHKARLPIIAVTAQAMAGDRERCLAAGMNDYLSKPITEAGLAAVLQRWRRPAASGRASDHAGDHLVGPDGGAGQAINPAVINRLRELAQATDPSLLAQILDAFRSDGAVHIDSLRTAAETGDAAALRTAAHVIKGASGTVGAHTLANLAQQLYSAGHSGSLAVADVTINAMIDALAQEFSRVLMELDSLEPPSVGTIVHENPDRR